MSMLSEVFGSLRTMTQLQLLLAFVACIGYAFAQGRLLPWKGRRIAWCAAAFAAAGFALDSADWTLAAMLLGFAIVGMGSFVALVWLTSRTLGFGSAPAAPSIEPPESAPDLAPTSPRATRSAEHAHSL